VKELFNQMMRSSGHSRPNRRLWNIFVEALGKAGEFAAMERAVSEMRHQGVQPDKVTFSSMLDAYGSHNQPEQMEETAAVMKTAGVEMDVVSYNTLMKGWSQAGRTDKVKELFNQMTRSSGHTLPNVRSWNIYVDALGKAGELAAMEQAVSEMER